MFSYFTELNRKRPPLDDIDLVTFTTCGLVHAGDDRTATETLEALPYIAKSARGDRRRQAVARRPERARHALQSLRRRADGEPAKHPPGDEPHRPAPARPARRRLVSRLFRPHGARRRGGGHARRRRRARSASCMRRPSTRSPGSTRRAASIRPFTSSRGWRGLRGAKLLRERRAARRATCRSSRPKRRRAARSGSPT